MASTTGDGREVTGEPVQSHSGISPSPEEGRGRGERERVRVREIAHAVRIQAKALKRRAANQGRGCIEEKEGGG